MDLVSHGLIGSMMAGLGLRKKFGIFAYLAMVIGNLAPDFDGILAVKGAKTFYKYHREVTHSLLGSAVMTLLISTGIYLATPFKHFWLTAAIIAMGIASHLLMDSFTPWGVPLFYPFKNKKYSFNLIWFLDPLIISTVITSVLVTARFKNVYVPVNIGAFALIAFYLIFRAGQRNKARKLVCAAIPRSYRGAKVWVLPSAISPFLWDVILQNRSRYMYVCIDTFRNEVLNRREYSSASYHRCVTCSQESELVEIFLKRARFPFYNIFKDEGTYIVEWLDVHLMQLGGVHGVRVAVDNETGSILEEKLKVQKPVRRRKKALQSA